MSWPEVEAAKRDNKHELVLSGAEISSRIDKGGLDVTLFDVTTLNFLDIHDTCLGELPDSGTKLANLQTLVLHSNRLEKVTPHLDKLTKLKLLDLSRNRLKEVPDAIALLPNLYSLNVSNNALTKLPTINNSPKLGIVDASNNKLTKFPDVCHKQLTNLSELKLSNNEIDGIDPEIANLSSLKVLLLSSNKIKTIPDELSDCAKLKELDLKSNPIADRRLLKLIEQCRTKQILDYVKQHKSTGGKGKNKAEGDSGGPKVVVDYKHTIRVVHSDKIRIVATEEVKSVRPHIAACLVHGLAFTQESLKRFIKLQTKLHETVCDKRNFATIATHDYAKVSSGDLTYTAMSPDDLKIKPLNRNDLVSGSSLYEKLKAEADEFRKEKKRNVYSGIHKYLYLLDGHDKYPCLISAGGEVISFPPITNSDITKISTETKVMLVEVTSSISQNACKGVLDALLRDFLELYENDELVVQQIRVTDTDGNLKTIYPSKTDLVCNKDVNIIRD